MTHQGDGSAGGFDAKSTYDAASRDYEDASRDFWQYISLRTVDRLDLQAGERILDVPCGNGPSLLLAAQRVGPTGRVVGLDYAEQMVAIAREKATAGGLGHVELSVGDMTAMEGVVTGPFDAVVCSLGLFFVDDMPALLRSLLGLVRPGGGRLGVAVFGEHVFDPMRHVFVEALRELAPGVEVLQPWRRTEDVAVLRGVFDAAGLGPVDIETEDDLLPLGSADDWWRIVMGSGFRRTVAALDESTVGELRNRCEAYILDEKVDEILNRTHYAIVRACRESGQPVDPVGPVARRFGEQVLESVYEVPWVGRGAPVVAARRGEDDPGVVFTAGAHGADDPIEVLGILGHERPSIPARKGEELFVFHPGEHGFDGSSRDVMACLAQRLGDHRGMMGVEQELQPASRSCWRRHSASASSAADALAASSASISAVNSA